MSTICIRDIVCEPGHKASGFLDVAETPGSTVRLPVMIANGVEGGPTICLVGGAHPTEYCGIVSIIRMMQELDTYQLTGAVIAVPVANLPGFQVIEAFNPIDGLQFQEACPGTLKGTMTHRIAYTHFQEVLSRSDYVIDFHDGGRSSDHMENTILKLMGDEKIDSVSEGMARHFLLKHISLRNVRKTGSGSVDGAILRGKSGFTVEVGGEGRLREDLVELNLRGTKNVLRYLKILKGEPQAPPEQKIMRRVVRLISNRGGIFLSRKKSADTIKKGETLGEVMDLFGNVVEAITAPFDGVIYSVYHLPPINAGDITFMVASMESGPEGELSYTGGGYKGYREHTYRIVANDPDY